MSSNATQDRIANITKQINAARLLASEFNKRDADAMTADSRRHNQLCYLQAQVLSATLEGNRTLARIMDRLSKDDTKSTAGRLFRDDEVES